MFYSEIWNQKISAFLLIRTCKEVSHNFTLKQAPTVALQSSEMHGALWRKRWWSGFDHTWFTPVEKHAVFGVWLAPATFRYVACWKRKYSERQSGPSHSIRFKKCPILLFKFDSYDRWHHPISILFQGSMKAEWFWNRSNSRVATLQPQFKAVHECAISFVLFSKQWKSLRGPGVGKLL